MSAQPAPDPRAESERLDIATDQAIALAGGDMRSAIRSLILALEFFEHELNDKTSHGYVRGIFLQKRSDWYD